MRVVVSAAQTRAVSFRHVQQPRGGKDMTVAEPLVEGCAGILTWLGYSRSIMRHPSQSFKHHVMLFWCCFEYIASPILQERKHLVYRFTSIL